MHDCSKRIQLAEEVQLALSDLIELIQREREAIQIAAPATVAAIDEQIEMAFGRKERKIGALYQHRAEHGC